MSTRPRNSRNPSPGIGGSIALLIRAAARRGLTIDRAVKIGTVRGVIIGYNIARTGRFPGNRFPLLIKTELGIGKFGPEEVVPA